MLKVLLVIFLICFVIERLIPGWKLPHVKTWPKRVLLLNLVQIGVVTLAGYLIATGIVAGAVSQSVYSEPKEK